MMGRSDCTAYPVREHKQRWGVHARCGRKSSWQELFKIAHNKQAKHRKGRGEGRERKHAGTQRWHAEEQSAQNNTGNKAEHSSETTEAGQHREGTNTHTHTHLRRRQGESGVKRRREKDGKEKGGWCPNMRAAAMRSVGWKRKGAPSFTEGWGDGGCAKLKYFKYQKSVCYSFKPISTKSRQNSEELQHPLHRKAAPTQCTHRACRLHSQVSETVPVHTADWVSNLLRTWRVIIMRLSSP